MEAAKDAHAICVLTEWDEFKAYDYQKVRGQAGLVQVQGRDCSSKWQVVCWRKGGKARVGPEISKWESR